jgi:hypothetical protein
MEGDTKVLQYQSAIAVTPASWQYEFTIEDSTKPMWERAHLYAAATARMAGGNIDTTNTEG